MPALGPRAASGLLLLDKPLGPTSHDAVMMARRALGTGRVGHCGSLDPLATGLLLLVTEDALKYQNAFMGQKKTYRGKLRLGLSTDTDDLAGKPLPGPAPSPERVDAIDEARLTKAFAALTGAIEQRVPRYSAVKVKGRRLYELAREGIEVELPTKSVTIYRFELLSYQKPEGEFLVECSKGAYIRSLVRDVGAALGVGAVLSALCRESIGDWRRENAFHWDGGREAAKEALLAHFTPLNRLPGFQPGAAD